jgi:hypothetical protein
MMESRHVCGSHIFYGMYAGLPWLVLGLEVGAEAARLARR